MTLSLIDLLLHLVSAGSNKATIKFCDPEVLRREREQALLVEKSKREEKERRKLEQQLAKDAKDAKKKAPKEKQVRHLFWSPQGMMP